MSMVHPSGYIPSPLNQSISSPPLSSKLWTSASVPPTHTAQPTEVQPTSKYEHPTSHRRISVSAPDYRFVVRLFMCLLASCRRPGPQGQWEEDQKIVSVARRDWVWCDCGVRDGIVAGGLGLRWSSPFRLNGRILRC